MDDGILIDFSKRGSGARVRVYFLRCELMKILNIYGRMVSAGHWGDYAIDHLQGEAVFSIFRRTREMPLFRIYKTPALAARQGAWRIVAVDGRTLRRGHDLDQLLKYFNAKIIKAYDKKPTKMRRKIH